MEYLIGVIATLASVYLVVRLARIRKIEPSRPIRYSQSHVFNLIKPFVPEEVFRPELNTDTQSMKHFQSMFIRVAYAEGKAYWITDNVFYVADVVNGEIDDTTARQVDTMSMSKLELNKMMYIIEELVGDNSDNRDSGKS